MGLYAVRVRLVSLAAALCILATGAWAAWHSVLQVAISSSGCSQATTYNAALDGSQNSTAITTLICGMVTDGTFAKLDALHLEIINSIGNVLVNAINPGTFNLTNVVSGCTFTANQGLAGGSNCYYDTHFNPTTASSPQCTQNACSIGVCMVNARSAGSTSVVIGNANASQQIALYPKHGDTNNYVNIFDGNFNSFGTPANVQGSLIYIRTSSTVKSGYKNGSLLLTTSGDTSSAPNNSDFFLLAFDNSGTASQASADTLGYSFIGGSLTATDVSNIYSRLNTYITTVYTGGANPC